jgi:hypothetical protein
MPVQISDSLGLVVAEARELTATAVMPLFGVDLINHPEA